MYGWTNEDGEPIMDGVAYRFEQQLDYDSMFDEGDYYDRIDRGYYDEPEPEDPATCSHGDGNYPEGAGFECIRCDSMFQGPRFLIPDERGWEPWPGFFTSEN